jgi:serine/threonine protein kinase
MVKPVSKQSDDLQINIGRLLNNSTSRPFSDKYKFTENKGYGTFGTIHIVEDKEGKKRSVKVIKKENLAECSLTENNIKQLLELDHINLVKIYEIIEDSDYLYIVTEYSNGEDLMTFLLKKKTISENLVKLIIKQLLQAINYLHTLKIPIIHKDIRPESIFIHEEVENLNDITIKLGDFVTSFFFLKNKNISSIIGKPYYIAPELISGIITTKCDIWSIGAIMYMLLSGHTPYDGKEHEMLYNVIYYLFRSFMKTLNLKKNIPKKLLTSWLN